MLLHLITVITCGNKMSSCHYAATLSNKYFSIFAANAGSNFPWMEDCET